MIPDLELEEQPEKAAGKYGMLRKNISKEHKPYLYDQMLLDQTRIIIWWRSTR